MVRLNKLYHFKFLKAVFHKFLICLIYTLKIVFLHKPIPDQPKLMINHLEWY